MSIYAWVFLERGYKRLYTKSCFNALVKYVAVR